MERTSRINHVVLSLVFLLLCHQAVAQSVPIEIDVPEAGQYTLVVEDESGQRVRNLIQDQYLSAGSQTVYWDGYDEGNPSTWSEGSYDIARSLVEPGAFRLRALRHTGIDLEYEFSVQSPGNPAWHTADRSGAWLSDHAPAIDIVAIPPTARIPSPSLQVSARVAEAGHGVMMLDEDGNKKTGLGHVSNGFRFFQASTIDRGPSASADYMTWNALVRGGVIRLIYMRDSGGGSAGPNQFVTSVTAQNVEGIAAHNGFVAVSFDGGIAFFDARDARNGNYYKLYVHQMGNVHGLATDGQFLYVVSTNTVDRYNVDWSTGALLNKTEVIGGLEDGMRIRIHDNQLLVSDHGSSHQVKVYSMSGGFVRAIGTPGGPQIGIYDETRMSLPMGFDVDSRGKLWVAENSYMPKRISVWDFNSGQFEKAFYGPPKYGGGLVIDSLDSRRAYYSGASTGVIEFAVDWTNGTSVPSRILHNRERSDLSLPKTDKGSRAPQRVQVYNGERYFMTPAWSQSHAAIFAEMSIWHERGDTLAWVGQVGRIANWDKLFTDSARYPEIASYVSSNYPQTGHVFFVWTDADDDGDVSLAEISFKNMGSNVQLRYYLDQDLNVHVSNGARLPLDRVTSSGVPIYDVSAMTPGGYVQSSSAGQIIAGHGYLITTTGPLEGYRNGQRVWSYHSQWPSRADDAPVGRFSGDMIRTTRLISDPVSPPAGESGGVWAINSEHGEIYLMTTDGMFITTLLGDNREVPSWRYPAGVITRGSVVENVSPNDEHFWPFLNKGDDGELYLTAGKEHTSILRLAGFPDVRRHDFGLFDVTAEMLGGSSEERSDGRDQGLHLEHEIPIAASSIVVDGSIEDWASDSWMTIDSLTNSKAALRLEGNMAYLAVTTSKHDLLNNDGGDPAYTFVTGGGIDLQIGKTGMSETRTDPIEGDRRLVITRKGRDPVAGAPMVTLFEQVRPSAPESNSVTYESPVGIVTIDYVADVSSEVTLASVDGVIEVGIPLDLLGLSAEPGAELLADVGILVGDGSDTMSRIYWNNAVNTIVSDLPSEARLRPEYWGRWRVVQPSSENEKPTGVILSPSHGARIDLGTATDVNVGVSDPDGSVARVVLHEKGVPVMESTSAPFGFVWNPKRQGNYGLAIQVVDNEGASSMSDTVFVSVKKPNKGRGPNKTVVQLEQGWNIVSSAVVPDDDRMEAVLEEVLSSVVQVKDDKGNDFNFDYGVSTLDRWESGEAYMIYTDSEAELEIEGESFVPVHEAIELTRGWNFVPYYPESEMSVEQAFAGIAHAVALAKDYSGNAYIPEFGLDDIGLLQPGHGYKLYVTEDVQLVYPDAEEAGKLEQASSKKGGGVNSAVLVIDGFGWENQEIEVRTEAGRLVGKTRMSPIGRTLASVSADEILTENRKEGAVPGQRLVLTVGGEEVEIAAVADKLSGFDSGNEVYFGYDRLLHVNLTAPDNPFILAQNYPNPFAGQTKISYNVPDDMPVTLEVFDITGRLVKRLAEGMHTQGSYAVEMEASGLASGTYLYRLESGGRTITKLLTLLR